MKFLALLIAAIFLSAPALAETAQFAAAAKAAKVSSKEKNSAPDSAAAPPLGGGWGVCTGPN
jgi:hypothetical protein